MFILNSDFYNSLMKRIINDIPEFEIDEFYNRLPAHNNV